jgi:hypothetical protein
LSPAALRALTIASKKALRLRTRIITSLSRMRLILPVNGSTTRSREFAATQLLMASAMRFARITGGSSSET